MRPVRTMLLRGLASALIVAFAATAVPAKSLKGWRDGPAGALLTDDEYRRFGALRTDAARETFIDAFWNEFEGDRGGTRASFREAFERRCAQADARFAFGGTEGWRTDRGRVFIALGEPAAIRHESGGVDAIDEEIWTYTRADVRDTAWQMVFYRCHNGAYRVDPSCAADRDPTSVAFDDERADIVRGVRDETPAYTSGRVLSMLAELLGPVPGGLAASQAPLIRTRVAAGDPGAPTPVVQPTRPTHALANDAYFFRASDGTVLTILAFQLFVEGDGQSTDPAGAPQPPVGAAMLEETTRRGETVPDAAQQTVALDPAPIAGAPGTATLFGRAYLEAGKTYAVRFTVKVPSRDEILVRNASVGVPQLSRGFSASSVVPAEQFGPAGRAASLFQVGSEEVVPKVGGTFRRSELLRLYLQVYDAAIDPKTTSPRVDVVFRFYRVVNGISKRQGKPFTVRGAAGASMGLALPIGDWPAGPYRVEVDLHDRIAEQRILAEGRFAIAAD
jgi:GWxTD domain-containing protein